MLIRFWWLVIFMSAVALPRTLGQNSPPASSEGIAEAPGAVRGSSNQIVVPANTTIPLELRNAVTSRTAYVGQAVYCDTIYPITVNNHIVIPAGSWVKGEITQVVRPGRVKGRAQLGIRFINITLPNGTTRPLRATLSGFAGNGKEGFQRKESKVEGESSKADDAGRVAETTITGAEIGTIAGVGTHSVGKGLGIGSAAGALGGLVWVLATRGKDIMLPAGTNFELQLVQPLSFYRDEVDSGSEQPAGPLPSPREPGPGL
jgi:hypothetical protein